MKRGSLFLVLIVLFIANTFAQSDSGDIVEGVSFTISLSGGSLEISITDDDLGSYTASIRCVKRGNIFIIDGTSYDTYDPLIYWLDDQLRSASSQFYGNENVLFDIGTIKFQMILLGWF